MTVDSEVTTTSAQFTQILRSVKQLIAREQLTLAKLLLERVLSANADGQDEWSTGFFEATAGAWAGEPLVREPQGDYETRLSLARFCP
jgi:hypothetical protein